MTWVPGGGEGPPCVRRRRHRAAHRGLDDRGHGPDGEDINIQGTATDVARRDEDGVWRYIIENPFGTATQGP